MDVMTAFRDFAARQLGPDGKPCDRVVTGTVIGVRAGGEVTRIVFANGAVWTGEEGLDPPPDERTRLATRLEYLRTRLANEERAFHGYKASVLEQANLHGRFPRTCPAPPADAGDVLIAGAARVERLRDEIAACESRVAELDELGDPEALTKRTARAHAARLAEEQRQARAQQLGRLVHTVTSLNV